MVVGYGKKREKIYDIAFQRVLRTRIKVGEMLQNSTKPELSRTAPSHSQCYIEGALFLINISSLWSLSNVGITFYKRIIPKGTHRGMGLSNATMRGVKHQKLQCAAFVSNLAELNLSFSYSTETLFYLIFLNHCVFLWVNLTYLSTCYKNVITHCQIILMTE